MLDPAVAYVNISGVFPDVVGVNASGPSATDGFEFVANFVNDNNLGQAQMILNHAGLTPNGVVESDSASQIKEALQKGFGGHPGMVNHWHLASDPGTTGHRCLFLNGQGILRANFPELDAAAYVGDGNNAAVAAAGGGYYRADDAAGTIPNIVGIYLILPETRGYAPRGLDVAASVDPDGASRFLGDNQDDEFESHSHVESHSSGTGGGTNFGLQGLADSFGEVAANLSTQTSGGSTETRMTNFSTKFVIWF